MKDNKKENRKEFPVFVYMCSAILVDIILIIALICCLTSTKYKTNVQDEAKFEVVVSKDALQIDDQEIGNTDEKWIITV